MFISNPYDLFLLLWCRVSCTALNLFNKVPHVEIKHVDLDESMIRAIAKQAEAERERRAQVIHAEGELQASAKLLQAAQVLANNSKPCNYAIYKR